MKIIDDKMLCHIIHNAYDILYAVKKYNENEEVKFFFINSDNERVDLGDNEIKALILFGMFMKYDCLEIFKKNDIELDKFLNQILIEVIGNDKITIEPIFEYFYEKNQKYYNYYKGEKELKNMLSFLNINIDSELDYKDIILQIDKKYCNILKSIIGKRLHKDYDKLMKDFENQIQSNDFISKQMDEYFEPVDLSIQENDDFFGIFENLIGFAPKEKNKKNYVEQIGTNLNEQYYSYDPAIGRDEIIKQIAITLTTPNQSAMIIGPAGTGKTSIVKGLAYRIEEGKYLNNKKIIEIDTISLVSGKSTFGDFEANIQRIVRSLEENPEIIIFIDEIHKLYKLGINESNAMNNLKRPISEGKVRIIGATTKEEFEHTIKEDSAFVDRFDIYTISELSDKYLKQIIEARINYLEEYYNIALIMNENELSRFIEYLLKLTSKDNRKLNQSNHNPRLVIQMIDKIFATACINNHITIEYDDVISAITSSNKISYKNYKIPNVFYENEELDLPKTLAQVIDINSYKRKN